MSTSSPSRRVAASDDDVQATDRCPDDWKQSLRFLHPGFRRDVDTFAIMHDHHVGIADLPVVELAVPADGHHVPAALDDDVSLVRSRNHWQVDLDAGAARQVDEEAIAGRSFLHQLLTLGECDQVDPGSDQPVSRLFGKTTVHENLLGSH